MADSGALRVRRHRAHAAGDHSLCKRCAALRGQVVPLRGPAPVSREASLDPAAELRDLAARMVEAHKGDPSNAILAAELRKTLVELMGRRTGKPDDELAGLFAEFGAS